VDVTVIRVFYAFRVGAFVVWLTCCAALARLIKNTAVVQVRKYKTRTPWPYYFTLVYLWSLS